MTSPLAARRDRRLVWELGFPVAFVALWEIVYLIVREPALASPLASVVALGGEIRLWLPDLADTVTAVAIAFAINVVAGTLLGAMLGMSGFATRVVRPILASLYSLPKLIFYPVFLLIFGVTMAGKVGFGVFHGIFPIVIICMEAVQTVPSVYLKVARVHRLGFLRTVRVVLVPALLPQMVGAWRTGFNLTFLGVILSEMFSSYQGMGYRLSQYMNSNKVASILALFMLIAAIAIVLNFSLLTLEQRQLGPRAPRSADR